MTKKKLKVKEIDLQDMIDAYNLSMPGGTTPGYDAVREGTTQKEYEKLMKDLYSKIQNKNKKFMA